MTRAVTGNTDGTDELRPFERLLMRKIRESRLLVVTAATFSAATVSGLATITAMVLLGVPLFEFYWWIGVVLSIGVPLVVASAGLSYVARLLSLLDGTRAKLEQAAHVDPLTGALNRRGFSTAISASNFVGTDVAMLDINRFKEINDLHGHALGDAALTHVAQWLADHAGSEGIVGRFGGDEFVAAAPGRWLEAGQHSLDVEGVTVVVSVGVAALESTIDAAIKEADRILYAVRAS